jgi:hypothetical protein
MDVCGYLLTCRMGMEHRWRDGREGLEDSYLYGETYLPMASKGRRACLHRGIGDQLDPLRPQCGGDLGGA